MVTTWVQLVPMAEAPPVKGEIMSVIIAALLLAGGPVPPTIGEVFYGHAMGNNDPIADMTPLPPKLPSCRGDAEIQRALAEKAQGRPQSCLLPLGARPAKVEADQPKG